MFAYKRHATKGGIISILRYTVKNQRSFESDKRKKTSDKVDTVAADDDDTYYHALCMVDHFIAQRVFNQPTDVYLPENVMAKEDIVQPRWSNEKSWFCGNKLLEALGEYIVGPRFVLHTHRGLGVPDDSYNYTRV